MDEDKRMAALVLEVERRRKLPGQHNYSYGRLIADTTRQERDEIASRYKHKRRPTASKYKEADEEEYLIRIKEQVEMDE